MRHLTRLYFDNPPMDGATEIFIAVVDQGVNAQKSPSYAVMTGKISNPMTLSEQYDVLRYLQATPCFFKLPIGSSAFIDVYIPDEAGSAAPKIFDYQIIKARIPEKSPEEGDAVLHNIKAAFASESEGDATSSESSNRASRKSSDKDTMADAPMLLRRDGGGVGKTCHSGAPCGNETSIPCDDPLTQQAVCKDGRLVCMDI